MPFRVKITKPENMEILGVPENTVVNVPHSEYVPIVIASEMTAHYYKMEALKAQAISCYTFALYEKSQASRQHASFDVYDNTKDQAYNIWKKHPRADEAYEMVKDIVLTVNGKIFRAEYHHSDDNGHGRGMVQVEANELAKKGYDFVMIVYHFYEGARLMDYITKMKYLFQGNYSGHNYKISNMYYGCEADKDETEPMTIGYKGCAIVSTVMCIDSLNGYSNGSDYDHIKEAATFSMDNGYKKDNGTDIKAFATHYAHEKGLTAYFTTNKAEMYAELQKGSKAVISVNAMPVTKGTGHIIAASGINDGKVIVHNPNSLGYDDLIKGTTAYNLDEIPVSKGIVIIKKGSDLIYSTLKRGDRGKEVKTLQQKLIEKHYLPIDEDDGIYGGKTESAVQAFQSHASLPYDGVADSITQAKLYGTFNQPPDESNEDLINEIKRLLDKIK